MYPLRGGAQPEWEISRNPITANQEVRRVPDLALEARLSRTSSDDGDGIVWLFGVVFLLAYIPGGVAFWRMFGAPSDSSLGWQFLYAVFLAPAAGALVIETVLWTVPTAAERPGPLPLCQTNRTHQLSRVELYESVRIPLGGITHSQVEVITRPLNG